MTYRKGIALADIPAALAKTGFILEHTTEDAFRSRNWATIGGRYYADDVDGRARELDLVAYRARVVNELEVISGVLISCKKDESHTWAFMTKDKPTYDPNFDWNPIHYWTDVQPLQEYLATDGWKEAFFSSLGDNYRQNFVAKRSVFAFQQVSIGGSTSQNDRAIFDSIATLMKALDHEMQSLPIRVKNRKRLYVFHLVSVIDAPMVDVSYRGQEASPLEVDRITHLSRYMVRKRELTVLIHFIRSDQLQSFVDSLTDLCEKSEQHLSSLVASSYESIRWNTAVQNYFANKLGSRIGLIVGSALREAGGMRESSMNSFHISFEKDTLLLEVDLYDDTTLGFLNADPKVKERIASVLEHTARYRGKFVFVSDMPF